MIREYGEKSRDFEGSLFIRNFDDILWNEIVLQVLKAAPGHSWQAVTQGKSSIAHKFTLYAAKVIAASAIDLLEDSGIINDAKNELYKRTNYTKYVSPIPEEVNPY